MLFSDLLLKTRTHGAAVINHEPHLEAFLVQGVRKAMQRYALTKVLSVLSILMLLYSFLMLIYVFEGNAHTYYLPLCVVVCASAISAVYAFKSLQQEFWENVFVVIALIFNPLMPLYVNEPFWAVLCFVAAMVFLAPLCCLPSSFSKADE